MLFPEINLLCEEIHQFSNRPSNIRIWIARLDLIHPVVSGNKLFKLHYFIKAAKESPHKTVVTYGGAFSNHLVATAWYCMNQGLTCIGKVRGEEPKNLSHTLRHCLEYGMQLQFIPRTSYAELTSLDNPEPDNDLPEHCIIIPEGGYHPLGAKGASLIMDHINSINATHICTATGTATTLAGLIQSAGEHQQIVAIPVLKEMKDINKRLDYLLEGNAYKAPWIFDQYHFGGYAKKNAALLNFMNGFYQQHNIPTDFVYTAKMMAGILEQVNNGSFPEGSRIVCLHTGGLQGNASLPAGSLVF